MKTKKVKIIDIVDNIKNPRIIRDEKFEKLVKSIEKFPEMLELRPIVLNSDNLVLGGNMRLAACKFLGIKEVPVIYAEDLTEDEQNEFIIKDNVSFGDWDWDSLNDKSKWDIKEVKEYGLDVWVEFDEDDNPIPTGDSDTGSGADEEEYDVIEVICPNCATLFNIRKK